MRASAEISSASPARSAGAILADLVKARLTTLVLLTTFVGFIMGERGPLDFALMFHALAGTALVAAGAAALNQLLEREYDAKMRRTQNRPLPAGHLEPTTVMIFGGVCATAGLIYLALAVNLLTSVIGAVTLVSYLFIYTPLKRVTWLNTAFGAVPGALPPLMGWTAGRCLPSWRSGKCRTSCPSPGFTALTTRRPASKCCRWLTRTAAAPGNKP
jgi:heme o synthase